MAENHKLTSSERAKDTRLKSVYNTTLSKQNAQRAKQNNACAICGRSFADFVAFQDHDHACCKPRRGKQAKNNHFCGKCNRALLCYLCNKYAVGLLEWLHTMKIDFEKVVDYKRFWDKFLKENGAYGEKEIASIQPKQARLRRSRKKPA